MTTHNLTPTRDVVFGFLSWWCDTCGRHFMGVEDHDAQMGAAS